MTRNLNKDVTSNKLIDLPYNCMFTNRITNNSFYISRRETIFIHVKNARINDKCIF